MFAHCTVIYLFIVIIMHYTRLNLRAVSVRHKRARVPGSNQTITILCRKHLKTDHHVFLII